MPTYVRRDATGKINGPHISLPEDPNRTFVGEVHEVLKEIDLLRESHDITVEVEEWLMRIVDAAVGVGFDYGVAYGKSGEAK
ncbi:MAG: hypothetical protein K1X87_03025 [Dehalococcoidia bacterium]|nr:hypothetical protein [Dehalococcoidia bacterium]HRC62907.1 hypothetical protein [Dehalococcoidia bacterium]